MRFLSKNSLTKFSGLFIVLTTLFVLFSQNKWNDQNGVITADVRGYYAYLPALFIHNDLQFNDLSIYDRGNGVEVWTLETKDGKRFIKYTCGMAIMYSPFFALAHAYASTTDYPADGFSAPYKFSLALSSFVFMIIGLVFLCKFLLRYFEDRVVATTIILIYLGTNLFHYHTSNMTYSHGYSFALIALFLYSSSKWLDKPNWKSVITMGVTAGLIVLIRPIDILFLTAPLLLESTSLKSRIKYLLRYKWHMILMVVISFLVISPQLLYYNHVFGSFFKYSYTGERFFFGKPHLFDSLLNYRNGWLIYSPLMILSIIGLIILYKKRPVLRLYTSLMAILYFYLISSWWCWWYVGFGNRAFINLYPLLCLPLAVLIQWVYAKALIIRTGLNSLILIGVVFSMFNSYQYEKGAIHWGAMTKAAYWDSFLRESPSQLFNTYLRFPITHGEYIGRNLVNTPFVNEVEKTQFAFESFEKTDSTLTSLICSEEARSGEKSLCIPSGYEYIGKVGVKASNAIYVTAWVKNDPQEFYLTLSNSGEHAYYHSSDEVLESSGDWNKLHLYAELPSNYSSETVFFSIWNKGKEPCYIDDIDISVRNIKYEYKPY